MDFLFDPNLWIAFAMLTAERLYLANIRPPADTVERIMAIDARFEEDLTKLSEEEVAMLPELAEMSYEFDEPFVLDTTRFRTTFGSAGTPLASAVAETVTWYRTRTGASRQRGSVPV